MKPQKKTIRAVVDYLATLGLSIYGAHMDFDTGQSEGGCMDYDNDDIEKLIALRKRDPDVPHYPDQ